MCSTNGSERDRMWLGARRAGEREREEMEVGREKG